jgi:hypothetical protein
MMANYHYSNHVYVGEKGERVILTPNQREQLQAPDVDPQAANWHASMGQEPPADATIEHDGKVMGKDGPMLEAKFVDKINQLLPIQPLQEKPISEEMFQLLGLVYPGSFAHWPTDQPGGGCQAVVHLVATTVPAPRCLSGSNNDTPYRRE